MTTFSTPSPTTMLRYPLSYLCQGIFPATLLFLSKTNFFSQSSLHETTLSINVTMRYEEMVMVN